MSLKCCSFHTLVTHYHRQNWPTLQKLTRLVNTKMKTSSISGNRSSIAFRTSTGRILHFRIRTTSCKVHWISFSSWQIWVNPACETLDSAVLVYLERRTDPLFETFESSTYINNSTENLHLFVRKSGKKMCFPPPIGYNSFTFLDYYELQKGREQALCSVMVDWAPRMRNRLLLHEYCNHTKAETVIHP